MLRKSAKENLSDRTSVHDQRYKVKYHRINNDMMKQEGPLG